MQWMDVCLCFKTICHHFLEWLSFFVVAGHVRGQVCVAIVSARLVFVLLSDDMILCPSPGASRILLWHLVKRSLMYQPSVEQPSALSSRVQSTHNIVQHVAVLGCPIVILLFGFNSLLVVLYFYINKCHYLITGC